MSWYGALKSLHLSKDNSGKGSKFAFFEYHDSSCNEWAKHYLDGYAFENYTFKVRGQDKLESKGLTKEEEEELKELKTNPEMETYIKSISKVVCLKGIITEEDLDDDDLFF